ncbi:RlpA-like double-psi beta-barrel domain-containing protein [Amycolatopsis sp. cg5]|uniref:RlpA-like double-psi beta-barrel domain-containing protein n=1 Tax=Amycolatopsis sp. cg5 TaxID=3238802 RepID=UPI003525F304
MRKFLCVLATMSLVLGTTTTARAGVEVMTWVPSYTLCKLVPASLCLKTADGHTLQILDADVTLGLADCVDLPTTHGPYVRVYDNLELEAIDPALVLQMRTGSCDDGEVAILDTAFVNADTFLIHPIEGSVALGKVPIDDDATVTDFTGRGACGRTNSNSDLVFALPASMFDPAPGGNPNSSSLCGRKARITNGSESVIATVTDRSDSPQPPGKFGDIDLSPAAFDKIANRDEGRTKVTWQFVS